MISMSYTHHELSPSLLAGTDVKSLQTIFADEKTAKQILNAAKRVSKKRGLGDAQPESPSKRKKTVAPEELLTPAAIEASLSLPSASATDEELRSTVLRTNRAPLVLAFAVVLLSYTMPEQPLSSRLSLAQAVVSMNSRSKAVSIGLEKGNSAEEDGYGQGQPQVRIMGRDVRVMKRWGYDWKEDPQESPAAQQVPDSQDTIKAESSIPVPATNENIANGSVSKPEPPPALWGLDLEALRSSNENPNGGPRPTHNPSSNSNLPIYTAESARTYLLKSFYSALPAPVPSEPSTSVPPQNPNPKPTLKPKKPLSSLKKSETEHNLALLLAALDKLFASWAPVLSREDLDRRSWGWYVAVRPEIQQGVAGWGEKGEVKLGGILELCRISTCIV